MVYLFYSGQSSYVPFRCSVYSCVFQSSGSVESSPSSSPGSQAAPAPTTITIPNGAPKFGTLVPNRWPLTSTHILSYIKDVSKVQNQYWTLWIKLNIESPLHTLELGNSRCFMKFLLYHINKYDLKSEWYREGQQCNTGGNTGILWMAHKCQT